MGVASGRAAGAGAGVCGRDSGNSIVDPGVAAGESCGLGATGTAGVGAGTVAAGDAVVAAVDATIGVAPANGLAVASGVGAFGAGASTVAGRFVGAFSGIRISTVAGAFTARGSNDAAGVGATDGVAGVAAGDAANGAGAGRSAGSGEEGAGDIIGGTGAFGASLEAAITVAGDGATGLADAAGATGIGLTGAAGDAAGDAPAMGATMESDLSDGRADCGADGPD